MEDDIFGDADLFAEFDRERDQQSIFINYDKDESGTEIRSRIIFKDAGSDYEQSDSDDMTGVEEEKLKEGEGQSGSTVEANNAEESQYVTGDQTSQSTGYQEQFEKSKLQNFARIIDSTRCAAEEQSPGVQIIFHNNKFAKKYRGKIEQFLMDMMQHAERKDFSKPAVELSFQQQNMLTCVDLNDKLPAEKRNKTMQQIHGILGCAQFHHSFMVDPRGWPHADDEPKEFLVGELPKYYQLFDEVYPGIEPLAEDGSKPPSKKSSCFNCGGDHRLNECTQPKDHERIRAKRREHMDKANNSKNSNPGRYHEDPELDPKQKKFIAGELSPSLREAMGLKADQLPSYIYKMRLFGYPPGWLMEASRKSHTLAMYDRDGRETDLRGESLEDGECHEQEPTGSDTFDIDKIIEYPGFTVPVPEGFLDESDKIGMPPIQTHQLKTTLMEDMVTKEGNKKRRLEDEDDGKNKKLKTGPDDMDLDEESPESPTEESQANGEKETAEEKAEEKEEGEMEEESEKKEKGEATAAGENGNGVTSSPDVKNGENSATATPSSSLTNSDLDYTAASTTGVNGSADATLSTPKNTPQDSPAPPKMEVSFREKNFTFSPSTSISKDYGTPILVRERSFQQLPDAEKFHKGVEDHIPFENLPDSVGTFERMRKIFSTIKQKVKRSKK